MPNELYSRPLSPDARLKLINFVEAYINSMKTQTVDKQADLAKAKALEVLNTDIDILIFITTIITMHTEGCLDLIFQVLSGKQLARDIAVAIVKIMQEAVKRDKQSRTS